MKSKDVKLKDCGNSKKYRGIRPPKCNGGKGCEACRAVHQNRLDELIKESNSRIKELQDLIVQFADGEQCNYDHHHGYCQSHNLHSKPCPYGMANEMKKFLQKFLQNGDK